jgi:hypothetical protein
MIMSNVKEATPESKSIIEVLEYCKVQALPARVVGKWVWVEFESKPDAEVRQGLKDMGFRWSRRRGQWAHNCGNSSRPARSYRPWDKYQTTMLEDYVNTGLGV